MSRRRAWRLLAVAAAATAIAGAATGCGPPPGRVLARGVLPYGLATDAETLVAVELAERFELVVRPLPALAPERRMDLGPPEHDLRALAVHAGAAFVGSDAGWIWELDLATLQRRRELRVGAPVVALAVDERYLVSADLSRALCLRRRGDGALLQCAVTAFEVEALALDGERLWLRPAAGGAPLALLVPALAEVPHAEKLWVPPRWRGGELVSSGAELWWTTATSRRRLAAMASDIRTLVVTSVGVVVAAWPRRLDDAALVLVR